jgi:hypothetical protein
MFVRPAAPECDRTQIIRTHSSNDVSYAFRGQQQQPPPPIAQLSTRTACKQSAAADKDIPAEPIRPKTQRRSIDRQRANAQANAPSSSGDGRLLLLSVAGGSGIYGSFLLCAAHKLSMMKVILSLFCTRRSDNNFDLSSEQQLYLKKLQISLMLQSLMYVCWIFAPLYF